MTTDLGVQRSRFLHRRRTAKCALSFDQLLRLFRAPETTMHAIASQARITTAAVSLIYARYFRRLLGLTGQDRRRLAAMARHQRRPLGVPHDDRLRIVARRALDYGCAVEQVPQAHHYRMRVRRLRIAGVVCAVITQRTPWTPQVQYAAFHIPFARVLRAVGAVIFVAALPGRPVRVFVVPSRLVPRRRQRAYAKLSGAPMRHHRGWDLGQFEDRWNVLAELAPAAAGKAAA